MFNLPGVVIASLAVLVGVHVLINAVASQEGLRILLDYAFIPAVWTVAADPAAAAEVLRAAAAGDPDGTQANVAFARFILEEVRPAPVTFLTHALLHGSWMHLIVNGLWLTAFGSPIARRCGTLRFLGLAVLGVICGALAHRFTHAYDVVPMVGASAGVSALMAAAARFMFQPAYPGVDIAWRPRASLPELLVNRSALIFLGVWFAINLVSGLLVAPFGLDAGSIAWEAHIGGFLAGLLAFPIFDRGPAR